MSAEPAVSERSATGRGEQSLPPALRAGVMVVGVVSAAIALGFALEWSWATDLWPWPDGRYSYLFVASIAAAIAAASVVVVLEDDLGVLAPGALSLTVMFAGQSAFLFGLYASRDEGGLLVTALVLGAVTAANAVAWWRCRGIEPRDRQPMGPMARASFGLFVVVLVAVGLALVLGADIFPWPLDRDSSVMFGLIFLGDACFFAYGVARPRRAYATAQLAAFLAYDLVLLGPFLALFDDVASDRTGSLVVYTAVLLFSTVVAVLFLFVDRRTRLVGA